MKVKRMYEVEVQSCDVCGEEADDENGPLLTFLGPWYDSQKRIYYRGDGHEGCCAVIVPQLWNVIEQWLAEYRATHGAQPEKRAPWLPRAETTELPEFATGN